MERVQMNRVKEAQSTIEDVFRRLTWLIDEEYMEKVIRDPDTLTSIWDLFYDYRTELSAVERLTNEYDSEYYEKFKREIFNNLISTQREGQEFAYLCDLAETAAIYQRRSTWTYRKLLVRLLSVYPLHRWAGDFHIGYEVRSLLKRLSRYSAFFVMIRAYIINECAKSQLVSRDPQRFPVFSQGIVRPDIMQSQTVPTELGVKLTWTCNPATAGFIIAQLVRNGFIEPPAKNGNLNYAELGRICSQIFDFKDNNPTPESWRKVLNIDASGGNQLSRINRAKFTFPYKDDLAN